MTELPPKPPAVTVGLCAHGLAVARALDACGVTVHGLERDAALLVPEATLHAAQRLWRRLSAQCAPERAL